MGEVQLSLTRYPGIAASTVSYRVVQGSSRQSDVLRQMVNCTTAVLLQADQKVIMLSEATIGLCRSGRLKGERPVSAIRVDDNTLNLLACLPTFAAALSLHLLELPQIVENDTASCCTFFRVTMCEDPVAASGHAIVAVSTVDAGSVSKSGC